MANVPDSLSSDDIDSLQASGKISPVTADALRGRALASVPVEAQDSGAKFGMKDSMLDDKTGIRQFPVPAGQGSLTDPSGFTKPADQPTDQPAGQTTSGDSIWDKIQAGYNKAKANGFMPPSSDAAAAPDDSRVPTSAPAPMAKIDPSQLATIQPQPQSSLPPMPTGLIDEMNKGYGMESSGIQGMANAQSDAAKGMADAYGSAEKNSAVFDKQIADNHAQRMEYAKQQMDGINNTQKQLEQAATLNPNHYWQSMSTGGKVLSLVGIALGGFGGGLTGKMDNPVMDQINKYIDRDIDAQKQNYERLRGKLGTQSSVYGLGMQQFGDSNAALLAAKASALGIAELKIKETAARAQSPEVQARAQMMLGDITQKKAQMGLQLNQMMYQMGALRQATNGGGVENPIYLPEDIQKKAVKMPNGMYRLANSEDGAKEISKTQVAAAEMKNTLLKMRQLQGASIPYSDASRQAQGLMSDLLFQNQNLSGVSRLSAEDVEQLQKQTVDVTGWRQGLVTKMLDQLDGKIDAKVDAVRGQYLTGYRPLKVK